MKSFTVSCILAATAMSVRVRQGDFASDWESAKGDNSVVVLGNLQAHVDERIDEGGICLACEEDFDVPGSSNLVGVATYEDQADAVLGQIEAGFKTISDYNAEVETMLIEEAQDYQQDLIEEIMDDANESAADIIESESDISEAAEEVEELMEEAAKDIGKVNKGHDVGVTQAAKTAFIAEITNEAVKDSILKDFKSGIDARAPLDFIIDQEELPFNVQTPDIDVVFPDELDVEYGDFSDEIEDEEFDGFGTDDKLDVLVARNGGNAIDIKKDPQFNSFLSDVLDKFTGLEDDEENDNDFWNLTSNYQNDFGRGDDSKTPVLGQSGFNSNFGGQDMPDAPEQQTPDYAPQFDFYSGFAGQDMPDAPKQYPAYAQDGDYYDDFSSQFQFDAPEQQTPDYAQGGDYFSDFSSQGMPDAPKRPTNQYHNFNGGYNGGQSDPFNGGHNGGQNDPWSHDFFGQDDFEFERYESAEQDYTSEISYQPGYTGPGDFGAVKMMPSHQAEVHARRYAKKSEQ